MGQNLSSAFLQVVPYREGLGGGQGHVDLGLAARPLWVRRPYLCLGPYAL